MAGVIFIPALFAYFNSSRPERNDFSLLTMLIPDCETLVQRIIHFVTPPGYETGLGLPLLVIISFGGIILSKKQFRVLKITYILFMIGYFIPLAGSLMNGFSYSTDRWTYQLFFLSALTVSCFLNNYKFRKIKTKEYLCLFCLLNIAVNGFINNGPVALGGCGWSACFKSYEDLSQISNSLYARSSQTDKYSTDDFYRLDINDTTINASLIFNNNSTNSYYSITNNAVNEFYTNMLISPSYFSSFCFQGLDSRQSLNMLMSVQKYMDKTNPDTALTNPFCLPLGFTYDTYTTSSELSSSDALLKSHIVSNTVILDDDAGNIPLQKYDLTLVADDIQQIPVSLAKAPADNSIIIEFDSFIPSSDFEYYLYLTDFTCSDTSMEYVDIGVCDKTIRLFSQNNTTTDSANDYLIKISNNCSVWKNGMIKIELPNEGNFSFEDARLHALNISNYADAYTSHQESALEI